MIRAYFSALLLMFMTVEGSILLKDHENVAIATDLEPDDILALGILFKEANQLYTAGQKYPIELIIVGEGNTTHKRMRMERMLESFFEIPEGVVVEVVEGQATENNIFPFDGEELFHKSELIEYPFKDNLGESGIIALNAFLRNSENPLIIQLKPAQELMSLPLDLTQKTTIFFYGSFNLRKTATDIPFDAQKTVVERLQVIVDHFSNHYLKVGILESYGLLGEQSAVFKGHSWTDAMRYKIENSMDDFIIMFRQLVYNWNTYLLIDELPEIQATLERIIETSPEFQETLRLITQLNHSWNESLFIEVYSKAMLILESQKPSSLLDKLERGLKFADKLKPSSGVQFTLSDVGVALAVTDKENFFTSTPVIIKVNPFGYLVPTKNPNSNVFYYDAVDKDHFSSLFLTSF